MVMTVMTESETNEITRESVKKTGSRQAATINIIWETVLILPAIFAAITFPSELLHISRSDVTASSLATTIKTEKAIKTGSAM